MTDRTGFDWCEGRNWLYVYLSGKLQKPNLRQLDSLWLGLIATDWDSFRVKEALVDDLNQALSGSRTSSATKLVGLSFKYINNSPLPPRGKELSKDLMDAIIKLYKESKSQRQIAKIIGKSPATGIKIIEKFQAE
ncbi:hypothetical protein TNCT_227561 [Trichonephila clavata]|uniref:Uncharacterized protein n=1 Tax=Trichonephila clavata TaxID=2740835 RepID=A0A8X6GSP0_TRICU|nr:hypothetical protein TNCT_227561 [Trichonephila clavata]